MNNMPSGTNYLLKGRKRRLLRQLKQMGIKDERILQAIAAVPREHFVKNPEKAYDNVALPIGKGQTISQPYTVAFQTLLLNPQKGERILEIGTGSGYQAAILAFLGAEVFSIERIPSLSEEAKERLQKLGFKQVHCFVGDGTLGLPQYAPYDGILVTAAAPAVPKQLLEQLKVGGRLVIPVGKSKSLQRMLCIYKKSSRQFERSEHGFFAFVPLIGKEGWH